MSIAEKQSPATPDDAAFYRENGFKGFPEFFSVHEIAVLRDAIDRAIETNRERILGAPAGGRTSEAYEKVFNQMVNLWTDFPDVKAYSFNHALAETARRLSACRHVRIYHDHAMVKPGGSGSRATNWHQDMPYWPMEPDGALSAWVAVDDVTV